MRIAALDDEMIRLELIQHTMLDLGHECHVFTEISALMQELQRQAFDLLIFDWSLSTISSRAALQWLLADLDGELPTLFITNHFEEGRTVEHMVIKTDDFIIKPFRINELKARVTALLHRTRRRQVAAEISVGPYTFLTVPRLLSIHGRPVKLRPLEYQLALLLFKSIGKVVTREHLLKTLWTRANEEFSRSLDTHISHVRSKLGLYAANGFSLIAVYGLGYRLETVTPMTPQISTAMPMSA
jgi:DNA-binding response OmpR family regulator